MLKNALFFRKNCKNRQVLGALPPDPAGSFGLVSKRFKILKVQIELRSNKLKKFQSGRFCMKSDRIHIFGIRFTPFFGSAHLEFRSGLSGSVKEVSAAAATVYCYIHNVVYFSRAISIIWKCSYPRNF